MVKFFRKSFKKKTKEPPKTGKKSSQKVEKVKAKVEKRKNRDRAVKIKLDHEETHRTIKGQKHKNAFDALFLHRLLQSDCEEQVDPCASVFLEGVLQYLAAELMELSYNKAKARAPGAKICIVTKEDVKMAIRGDDELSYLIRVEEGLD